MAHNTTCLTGVFAKQSCKVAPKFSSTTMALASASLSWASKSRAVYNELFYMDKTMMVFGDAKKVVEDMVKAVD